MKLSFWRQVRSWHRAVARWTVSIWSERMLIGCAVLLGLGFALATGLLLLQTREDVLARSRSSLAAYALLLADQADRSFQALDLVHMAVNLNLQKLGIATAAQFRATMSGRTVFEDLKDRTQALPQFDAVALVDTAGRLVTTTRFWPYSPLDLSGEEHIRAFANNPGLDSFVSAPTRHFDTGEWCLFVVRRFTAPDGTWLGLLMGTVDLRHFQDLYRRVSSGGLHSSTLFRDDGRLLVRYPVVESAFTRSFAGNPMFQKLAQAGDTAVVRLPSLIDSVDRIVARKDLTRYPIFAATSMRMQDVLAPWHRQAAVLLASVLVLELGLAGFVRIALRHLRVQRQLLLERERASDELRRQRDRFEEALDNMVQGLCMFDANGHLLVANRRLAKVFGLARSRSAPGMTIDDLMRIGAEDGVDPGTLAELKYRLGRLLEGNGTEHFSVDIAEGRALSVNCRPLATGGWLATFEDITERRQAQARIEYMARHDGLTNLPNRVLLRERMGRALARRNLGEGFAVLCLDLDGFKEINDQFGHAAGDALLQAFAMRLLRCVREVDTVARLGGDEFAIVQAAVAEPDAARLLAERLSEELALPYDLPGLRVVVHASIGIALCPEGESDPERLLRQADLAMYKAKSEGRQGYRFFEPEMDAEMQRRRRLEADLRRALEADEFEPFYQPLVALGSGRVCGFEALVRWRHPERGWVMPGEFIALAEETGLIAAIGESVLRRACRDALAWPGDVKVAVNLSPVQFRSGTQLMSVVREALEATELPPQRLELEITESVLLHDSAQVTATLHEIRAMGVRLALDDFGTGYSSLSYLRRFPFSKVKVDRSFVQDLCTQAESAAIVRAVTEMGRSLGMTITAEGVETDLQLRELARSGCAEGQGYLFSPAVPAEQAAALAWRAAGQATVAWGRAAKPAGTPSQAA